MKQIQGYKSHKNLDILTQNCNKVRKTNISTMAKSGLTSYSNALDSQINSYILCYMSHLMSNRKADQRLCFRYSDSTIPLRNPKISSF